MGKVGVEDFKRTVGWAFGTLEECEGMGFQKIVLKEDIERLIKSNGDEWSLDGDGEGMMFNRRSS